MNSALTMRALSSEKPASAAQLAVDTAEASDAAANKVSMMTFPSVLV
jgi:hypothetical protein